MQQGQTLVVEANFESAEDLLNWATGTASTLPEAVRPTHFGDDERSRPTESNQISHSAAFSRFVATSGVGFFLFGRGSSVLVSPRTAPLVSEMAWHFGDASATFAAYAGDILRSLAEAGAAFAFACEWAEYEARNRYLIRCVDGATAEGFIGRDIRRYVPGLYWLTYLSRPYATKMRLDVATVAARIRATVESQDRGDVLRLYDRPSDWRGRREEVEGAILTMGQFFSMRRVEIPTDMRARDLASPRGELSRLWP